MPSIRPWLGFNLNLKKENRKKIVFRDNDVIIIHPSRISRKRIERIVPITSYA